MLALRSTAKVNIHLNPAPTSLFLSAKPIFFWNWDSFKRLYLVKNGFFQQPVKILLKFPGKNLFVPKKLP